MSICKSVAANDGRRVTPARRRRLELGTWRVVRYADDFVVLVFGSRENVESVWGSDCCCAGWDRSAPVPTKTQIVHMSEGLDFLGFHIQWRRKFGTTVARLYLHR